jgi:hypothetical protein
MNELQMRVLQYFAEPARSWRMAENFFPEYERNDVHETLYSLVGAGLIRHIRGKTNDAVYEATPHGKALLEVAVDR